jgi:two-component system chemotaxis sensor kinase CheA
VAEKKAAIQVDRFLSALETVIKNLGRQLRRVRHVAGATILGDGRLVMVLNSADLMKSILTGPAYPSSLITETEPVQRRRLLVVDDSITTRTLQKHILEKAGYEVISASDGQEAWEYLKHEQVQLVISDVDMPNMDGIELTKAIKSNHATANLPVILVTSLAEVQDRLQGMQAGADAYIVKTNFDQNELLETIEQYIRDQASFTDDSASISSNAARS